MPELPTTALLYRGDAARLTAEAKVLAVLPDGEQALVALDATVFYPTGGGQPHDTGEIRAGGASWPVTNVETREGVVWHRVQGAGPAPGASVTLHVDGARREDHRQQHTGQHLLSALAFRDFGCDTVSFHLGESYSSVDLAGPALDEAKLRKLEDAVNAHIRAALPCIHADVGRETWEEKAQRKKDLPEDVGGTVRMLSIGELDHNACGGTHCTSTAQLQACVILGAERVRDTQRVSFLFGTRVVARLRELDGREAALRKVFGCAPEEWAGLWEKREEERKALRKEKETLRASLRPAQAMRLVQDAVVEDDHFRIEARLDNADGEELKRIATEVFRFPQKFVLLLSGRDGNTLWFHYAMSEGLAFRLEERFRADLSKHNGKGGGRGLSFQGKA